MRVLLDTHALIWWSLDDAQLSRRAREVIAGGMDELLVSAASAWEIATKYRIGKLPEARLLAEDIAGYLRAQGFSGLPVTVAHAARAGALPGPMKDPFDRMLVAQAQAEGVPIISNEEVFDRYGISRIW